MNSVYDVIEVLSAWRGFTMKEVALRAGLSYTTFASMMSRRPVKIAKRTLQSIGTVFGTEKQGQWRGSGIPRLGRSP